MLVLRSDLLTGFKNKFFEVNIKNVDYSELCLKNNLLICNLTSRVAKNGYKISGYLINNVILNCDRCLESFCANNKINLELFLSNNAKTLKDENNTIYFSDKENSIDFKKMLLDILLVEIPIKNLCVDDCKGICSICGINLNHNICICNN
tara:strand:- start:2190 stop:2639 length:450 start_codon:yes stop_codon:yes gene_type:complete